MIKKDLLKKKYDDFLIKYGKNYDEDTLDFIKENFWTYRNSSEAPCVLRQLYSAFESIPEDQDVYRAHLKRIKNNFGLRK